MATMFPTSFAYNLLSVLYGEEQAMHNLHNIALALKGLQPFSKKNSLLSIAHYVISYCAVMSGNLSWIEDMDDAEVHRVAVAVYTTMPKPSNKPSKPTSQPSPDPEPQPSPDPEPTPFA